MRKEEEEDQCCFVEGTCCHQSGAFLRRRAGDRLCVWKFLLYTSVLSIICVYLCCFVRTNLSVNGFESGEKSENILVLKS